MSPELARKRQAEFPTLTVVEMPRNPDPVRPLSGSPQTEAKRSPHCSDGIKKLLITANGEQDNEGKPGTSQQSDNREIMTSGPAQSLVNKARSPDNFPISPELWGPINGKHLLK